MFLTNNIIELIARFLNKDTTTNFRNINSLTKLIFKNNNFLYKNKLIDLFSNRIIFGQKTLTIKSKCKTKAVSFYHQNNYENAFNLAYKVNF